MENFKQLCVMQGTTLEDSCVEEFEYFFTREGFRIKFAEEVETNEILEDGSRRRDLLFYIHEDDVDKFALWKFNLGIRWWEDIVSYNDEVKNYKEETLKKYPVNW